MNGQNDYINPWAEKLEQVTIPDVALSWTAMQALLDTEMPVKQNHLRRWVILILLLLLLIGVCNCPGVYRMQKAGGDTGKGAPYSVDKDSSADQKLNKKNKGSVDPLANEQRKKEAPQAISKTGDVAVPKKDAANFKSDPGHPRKNDDVPANNDQSERKVKEYSNGSHKSVNPQNSNVDTGSTGKVNKVATENEPVEKEITHSNDPLPLQDTITTAKTDSIKKIPQKRKISEAKPRDSTANTVKKKGDREEYGKGWEAAIGLNQVLPVGRQQGSNYNSGGTTGALGDYIPVPIGRYYFSRKSYVQAELQFNSPQYTSSVLASQSSSTGLGGSQDQNSIFIKKLFYFNLPVSFQYSPVRNLFIGAGLQFSLLTNGVALFEEKEIIAGGADSVKSSKVQNFKNTPAYKHLTTTEWRFLGEINYHWKPITLGLRYNRALTDFINIPISNTQVTQARNSSLQLYLNYIVWRKRKKVTVSR